MLIDYLQCLLLELLINLFKNTEGRNGSRQTNKASKLKKKYQIFFFALALERSIHVLRMMNASN